MPLDLSITPLYRLNGEEQASLPGLMAAVPPRKAARGREPDRLVVYLLLTGNTVVLTGEYVQLSSRAAEAFYRTPGTLTSALRAAADSINKALLERNMSTSGRGQYAVGWLALAAMRETQITLLLSGPMHVFLLGARGPQHIFDTLSGKGLGLSQSLPYYFSQLSLQPNDHLLFCGKVPSAWEAALAEKSPASFESIRRRLLTLATEDLNAVLLHATDGPGVLTMLRPAAERRAEEVTASRPSSDVSRSPDQAAESTPEALPAKPAALQPSAYAIPRESQEELLLPRESTAPSNLFASLPRARAAEAGAPDREPPVREPEAPTPRPPSLRTRQAAKMIASGMQAWRRGSARIGEGLRNFLPRLLPGSEESSFPFSSSAMIFIAVLIPLIVVTIASAVYFRYGRSVQYEEYLVQAQDARAQALGLADAAAQREAWQRELFYLDKAESYSETAETRALRQEAQAKLDQLQGIARLQFQPVLNTGVGAQVSRLAASENDLYLLDAQRGDVLHIALTSGGFELDRSFNCDPGSYGGYTVGPLVDILAMPPVNAINATLVGVDAAGTLLYCAPGQVAQAIPLPPPDTNWGRVKAFTLDSGNLYVLDAQSRAVWVYVGKDGTFVDRPYFFFGGQIPALEDAIDLAVSGDDLYILHSDGHLSTCSYSRIETVPTRCQDPASLTNPFPAYRDVDLFAQAHFTQMVFTPAPDSALLLLDSDGQGVYRFAPRSLELQSQLRPLAGRANPLPQGPVGALTVSPNHVLYFAVQDRVYFSADIP
jgi:hypothetical protein